MIESLAVGGLEIGDEAGAYALTSCDLGSPAPRPVVEELPGDHGTLDATTLYGPRTIQLEGEVWGATWPAFWQAVDDLKGAMSLAGTRALVMRREGMEFDETCTVRVDGALDLPLQSGRQFAVWGVTLVAPDPRLYGPLQVASYDLTPPTPSGVEFPLEFPLVFSEGAPADAVLTVDVGGNFPTPPRFVVVGPVTDPTITNETTGEDIVLDGVALLAGEELHVDVRTRTVRLDSAEGTPRADLVVAASTDWWSLAVGENVVRLTGTGTTPGSTTLTVAWRDARI